MARILKYTNIHKSDTRPTRVGYYVASAGIAYCEMVMWQQSHPDRLDLDYWNGFFWLTHSKGSAYTFQERYWFGLDKEFK